jgi:carbon-monoxide dehydrogenase medium subunit
MKLWSHYYMPETVDDAAALLAQYGGSARVIAGGTDLLVEAKAGAHDPFEALVDVTRIPELCRIERDGDHILIGAGVTAMQIVASPIIQQSAICLAESCGVIGGPQVRNVATLGGNVAHALPAGDGTTSLVALDAQVEILQNNIRRWVGIREMFLGPAQSFINPTRDLLLRFRFKSVGAREGTAFDRIMRPQGVALPILGCAVWVRLNDSHSTFEAARVCIAPAGPTPARLEAVETALVGKSLSAATLDEVIVIAQDTLILRTSKYRATADYRYEMAAVLLRRTLTNAIQRAKGEGISTSWNND